MIKYFYLYFLLLPVVSFSQNNANFNESSYYETMQNKLNVKFEIDNDIESYEFDDGITSYNIKPNSSLRTSISANTRFLTIRIGYSPNFLADEDTDEKGETKVFKLNLDIFMKNWMQTFGFSSVTGYYVDDPNNISPLGEQEYVILPDLKSLRIGGTTSYKFNKNLSFKAIFNQYAIQRKSAGSFIPTLTYQYLKLDDSSSDQDLRSFDLILNTGYFYTFVISNKWYANLGLSPGLGIEFNKITTNIQGNKDITKSNEVIFNINTLIGIGYNSKNFFSGITLRGIATTRDEESIVQFNTVRGIFQLYVGYRFNTPKFVDQSFDWIEDQNP
ncbi:MAG: DUF4421 family protein, partial [Flavobacteriaceae bacterium]|nr:DUF4421 family protein [Flavobacteriaceae bacterium]